MISEVKQLVFEFENAGVDKYRKYQPVVQTEEFNWKDYLIRENKNLLTHCHVFVIYILLNYMQLNCLNYPTFLSIISAVTFHQCERRLYSNW